ncbi:MAG: CBS domain-containing protein, partial [Lysobacterales bacterium]
MPRPAHRHRCGGNPGSGQDVAGRRQPHRQGGKRRPGCLRCRQRPEKNRLAETGDPTVKARDIMSVKVVTVSPSTPVRELAALMIEKHVSGLPVLNDSGKLVGMVSEGDLLRRPEIDTEKHRRRWASFFTTADEQAREFTKSHALRAADLMTEQVIHVAEETPLGDIVGLMEKHNVKRLPVLSHGKLVGIVSRADLLRALAAHQAKPLPAPADSDAAIRAAMNEVLAK